MHIIYYVGVWVGLLNINTESISLCSKQSLHVPSWRWPSADSTALPWDVCSEPTALSTSTWLPWYAGDLHTTTGPTITPPRSAGQWSVMLSSGDRCTKTSSGSNKPLSSGTMSRLRDLFTSNFTLVKNACALNLSTWQFILLSLDLSPGLTAWLKYSITSDRRARGCAPLCNRTCRNISFKFPRVGLTNWHTYRHVLLSTINTVNGDESKRYLNLT